jgi:hypothetical protein
MANRSGSGSRGGGSQPGNGDDHVADLLERLNLTKDEQDFVTFSDDEEVGEDGESLEFALIRKVMSPSPLHISTIMSAMRPAWGNPFGLCLRSVGDRVDNLFIMEFGSEIDKKKVLDGSPWVVGRYAVLLQDCDESLKPSDVSFIKVPMWARILDQPFGWMNSKRGLRATGLIGDVVKIEANAAGKVSGTFLRV